MLAELGHEPTDFVTRLPTLAFDVDTPRDQARLSRLGLTGETGGLLASARPGPRVLLAAAGGITLMSIDRRRRRTDLRARLGFNRIVISGRF